MLTESNVPKIVDFGSAIKLDKDKLPRGTPIYLAPECWEGKYTTASDMWAVGILLSIILFYKLPFSTTSIDEIKTQILELSNSKNGIEKLLSKLYKRRQISKKCKNFIKKLLVIEIKQRISAEEALDNEWIKEYN